MNTHHISQSGRSIIELLGVLAIMGVLSIMMLYGYRYSIYRSRVSQTLSQISTVVAGSKTIDLNNISESERRVDANGNTFIPVRYVISNVQIKPNDPYVFITPLNAQVSVYKDSQNVWRVQINYTEQMSFGDCESLLLSPVAEQGIGFKGRIYTQNELSDNSNLLKKICDYYTGKKINETQKNYDRKWGILRSL